MSSTSSTDSTFDALKSQLQTLLSISHYLSSVPSSPTIVSLRVKVLDKQLSARKAIDEYVLSDCTRHSKDVALERVEDAVKAVVRIISIFCVFGDPSLSSQYTDLRQLIDPSVKRQSHHAVLKEREDALLRLQLSVAFDVPPSHTLLSWGVFSSLADVPASHTAFTFLPDCAASNPEKQRRRSNLLRLHAALAYLRAFESTKAFNRMLLLDTIAALPADDEPSADGGGGGESSTATPSSVPNEFTCVSSDAETTHPLPPPYSLQNFAYGTTPYHSYMQLHSCPTYVSALRSCVLPSSSRHVVFGSSVGLLNLYAALSLDVPGDLNSHGYEILPTLSALSRKVLKASCSRPSSQCSVPSSSSSSSSSCPPALAPPSITFHNADMLTAPLRDVALLHLTSMCWDSSLTSALDPHLLSGLPVGCVVVDYSERLGKARLPGGGGGGAADEGPRFELVWEQGEEGRGCSWSDLQKMYVYVKVAGGGKVEAEAARPEAVRPEAARAEAARAEVARAEAVEERPSPSSSELPTAGPPTPSSSLEVLSTPKKEEPATREGETTEENTRTVSPVAAVGAVGLIGAGLFAISRMFGGGKK